MTRAELEAGKLNTSWIPEIIHPAIPLEYRSPAVFEGAIAGVILLGINGAWAVSDEWNQRLPNFKFTKLEDFLRSVWEGKP